MKRLERIYPHAIAVLGFILISLIYFYPVLQGKKIAQSDIVQYTGMAKEQIDFRATENAEPYWTNSAFGGMPTYQLGAKYPGGRNGLMSRIFGGGGPQSAVADGILSVMGMGEVLTSIAGGVQAMANLKFPIYTGTKITGYTTISTDTFPKLDANIKKQQSKYFHLQSHIIA